MFGLVLGFSIEYASRYFVKSERSSLPLPAEFLVNPVIDELFASVEGSVVTKTEDAMMLQKDDKQITIFIEEGSGLTIFTQKTAQGVNTLLFSEIHSGDQLKGGVSILTPASLRVGSFRQRRSGDVVGHRFSVTRQ